MMARILYAGKIPLRSKRRDFKRWLKSQTSDKHVIKKTMRKWKESHE